MPELYHPQFGASVRYELIDLPASSDAATAWTIAIMSELARADSQSPAIAAVVHSFPPSVDPRQKAEQAFWFVRRRLRFLRDAELARPLDSWNPEEVEVLIRPVDILQMPQGAGDCDDFSMLVAAILLRAGIRCAFVTLAADPESPERYSHVYVVAEVAPGEWFPLDASHGSRPGWEAENRFGKRRVWEIGGGNHKGGGMSWGLGETPWWQDLIKGGMDIGRDILVPRYGVPPPGGFIQTRDKTISRGGEYPVPFGFSAQGPAAVGLGSTTLLIGAAILVAFLVAKGNR